MHSIKCKLLEWNKKNLSKYELNLQETQNELINLQDLEGKKLLTKEEKIKMLCLTNKVYALTRQINIK